jgi:Arc/MetJ-type ribon-helix-helix transcriptional regulator
MREITLRIPAEMREELDEFVFGSGAFCSRAEFVRHAIRGKLDRETGDLPGDLHRA